MRPFVAPLCTTNLSGDVAGPFTVNAGESMCISDARVAGPITVKPGGALTVRKTQVTNGIFADAPAFFSLCDSSVSGPSRTPGTGVMVSNATVPLRIGDPANDCAGNRVAGEVRLSANTGGLTLGSNTVSRDVTLNNNTTGSVAVRANNVFGTLDCTGNETPHNDGQVNTAAAKTGQCERL